MSVADFLRTLSTNTLRRVLLEKAPPYAAIRAERIAIRPSARGVRVSDLPMPAPLRKLLGAGTRTTLGDLDGLRYADVLGHTAAKSEALRQLHGLLRVLKAAAKPPPPPPEKPHPGAGLPVARAIDAALDRLPDDRRRSMEMRFGAKGSPLLLRDVAARIGMDVADPHRKMDRWTQKLAEDAGPAVSRAMERVRRRAATRKSRLPSEEVDSMLGITRSKPRYGRDFYLRLLSRLEPRKSFAVTWGKQLPRKGEGRRSRQGRGSRRGA